MLFQTCSWRVGLYCQLRVFHLCLCPLCRLFSWSWICPARRGIFCRQVHPLCKAFDLCWSSASSAFSQDSSWSSARTNWTSQLTSKNPSCLVWCDFWQAHKPVCTYRAWFWWCIRGYVGSKARSSLIIASCVHCQLRWRYGRRCSDLWARWTMEFPCMCRFLCLFWYLALVKFHAGFNRRMSRSCLPHCSGHDFFIIKS